MTKFLNEQGVQHLLSRLLSGGGETASGLTTVDRPEDLSDAVAPFAWVRNATQPQPLSFDPACAEAFAEAAGIDINDPDAMLAFVQAEPNLIPAVRLQVAREISAQAPADTWPTLLVRGKEAILHLMAVPSSNNELNVTFLAQRIATDFSSEVVFGYFVGSGLNGWYRLILDGTALVPASPEELMLTADLVLQLNSPPDFWRGVILEGNAVPAGLYAMPDAAWEFVGPGGTGIATPAGLLQSRLLTENDYSTTMQLQTQTIHTAEVDNQFSFDGARYGDGSGVILIDDDTPVQVAAFRQMNNDGNTACALPTTLADIESITFTLRDMWWSTFEEYEATVTDVEPFTTVDGFESHKITGSFGTAEGSEVEFAICIGFRLSGDDPTRGYMLLPRDGFPQSSVYFKRTSGDETLILAWFNVTGSNATNALPAGKACRLALKQPLKEDDRINARIEFSDVITGGNLEGWIPDATLEFRYKASVLLAPAGHAKTDIVTSGIMPELGFSWIAFADNTVDANGLTVALVTMESYENSFGAVDIASTARVDCLEIITRT